MQDYRQLNNVNQNMSWWSKNYPLIPALGLLLGGVLWAASRVLAATGGRLIYALDDAYIHMALARRLAESGAWSVTAGTDFTNCASSILWPALLGFVYKLAGVLDWLPLALNLLFALAGLYWLNRYLLRTSVAPWSRVVLLAMLVPLTSLPSLAFVGMEHTLHALLTLVVALSAAELLGGDGSGGKGNAAWPLLLCSLPVAVMVRYESLFLAFVLAVLFFLGGKRKRAILILALAALPALAWGVFSVSRGWYFLPNSLMLKGAVPGFSPAELVGSAIRIITQFGDNPHLLVLVSYALVLILFFPAASSRDNARRSLLWIFVLTTALHLQFAGTGHFYRYDAYLVAFGCLAVGMAAERWLQHIGGVKALRVKFSAARIMLMISLLVLSLSPLFPRALRAQFHIPLAAANIHGQQCQLAAFLAEYYEGECVAANDIGAINYFADIRCLDIWGLSSMESSRLKRSGAYTVDKLEEMIERNGARIAVVYKHWLLESIGEIPSGWQEAGSWWVPRNVVLGGAEVTFYATEAGELEPLRKMLREFSGVLPPQVRVSLTAGQEGER